MRTRTHAWLSRLTQAPSASCVCLGSDQLRPDDRKAASRLLQITGPRARRRGRAQYPPGEILPPLP